MKRIDTNQIISGTADGEARATVGSERLAYSVSETARLIGVGRTYIYALIANGSLETVKLGARRLITRAAIEKLLASHAVSS